ncbi:MAG: right-handed parallel beta-helix repeat-containing protein [Verrucomicrobiaceae bacterium]
MLLRTLLLLSLSSLGYAIDLTTVADGKTDASAALQALIDSGAGRIDLPKGRYLLSQTLTIDLDKVGPTSIEGHGAARLIMAGAGPALHFIGTHEGSADPESVKENVWERQLSPMVDGVQIYGQHAEADGIQATGTHQITITRTTITHCRHGIHLSVRNRNVIIGNCHIYKNSGIGVFYDNVNLHQSNITGSHISYCAGGGVVNHGGNVRNLHIGTCDIESNMAADAPPTANVWLDSTGGSIGEVAITGCTIQHSSKAPDCANIRINGAGDDPALERRTGGKFTREGNVTITGNVFSDIQINVHITDSRGVTITGNTFWEGFQHDLLIERSSHVVVADNNFDRNPRYAVNGFNNAENNGIVLKAVQDSSFTGNVIAGVTRKRAAVDIADSSRLNLSNNTILDSDGVGLRLEAVSRSLVSDNIIRDDRDEALRSKAVSLEIIGGTDNQVGANLLGNGKQAQ